jgi:DNA-binding NarL/FixJ family response regulator
MSALSNSTRVLVLCDQTVLRESLGRALASVGDIQVVGCCAGIAEALAVLIIHTADIVLLDNDLGQERGTAFLPLARAAGFRGYVVVLAAALPLGDANTFVRQGVSSICLKSQTLASVIETVRLAAAGVTSIDERYFRCAGEVQSSERFTDREVALMRHVAQGLANKEIADRMAVSESAVKACLQRIFGATGVRTRSQLVGFALEKFGLELVSKAG